MPSVKNRWVKPGGSFNYTEGVKVYATVDIAKHDIVIMVGVRGGVGEIALASGTTIRGVQGRLLCARHAIPAGRYGVASPWTIVEGVNTLDYNGAGNGAFGDEWEVGDSNATAGTDGKIVDPNVVTPASHRVIAQTIKVDAINGALIVAATAAL